MEGAAAYAAWVKELLNLLLWGVLVANVVLFWAWKRQLPWPNVIVLFGGTVVYLYLAMGVILVLEKEATPFSVETLMGAIIPMPFFLASRLIAQDLWAWREGRPRYGYEIIALTAWLALWQLFLLRNGIDWTVALVICVLVLLWQVLMTPWLIRKSPAPAPRDWLGPVVWVCWVSGYWYLLYYNHLLQSLWRVCLLVLPGLLALWLGWRRFSAAKAKPDPA